MGFQDEEIKFYGSLKHVYGIFKPKNGKFDVLSEKNMQYVKKSLTLDILFETLLYIL